jgi:F-type H+-transporting ATPase subunit b
MADPAAVGAAAEQSSGGLPQFDLAQWPGEMFWMLITFGVMFLLFAKVFVPRVGGTIAQREDKIGGDIGEARRLRDEAEAQSKAAAEELAAARARAQKLALDAKTEAAAEAVARRAEEDAKLAETLTAAEARIAAVKAEAMTHVRAIAADTAAAIVERLTGAPASASEVDGALAGRA